VLVVVVSRTGSVPITVAYSFSELVTGSAFTTVAYCNVPIGISLSVAAASSATSAPSAVVTRPFWSAGLLSPPLRKAAVATPPTSSAPTATRIVVVLLFIAASMSGRSPIHLGHHCTIANLNKAPAKTRESEQKMNASVTCRSC